MSDHQVSTFFGLSGGVVRNGLPSILRRRPTTPCSRLRISGPLIENLPVS